MFWGILHVFPVTLSAKASTTSLPVVFRLKDGMLREDMGFGRSIQVMSVLSFEKQGQVSDFLG
jgi:hypothetical protein